MQLHGVNIERFAAILAKRRKRKPERGAKSLPELQTLSWYADALKPGMRWEVECAIEDRADEIAKEATQ